MTCIEISILYPSLTAQLWGAACCDSGLLPTLMLTVRRPPVQTMYSCPVSECCCLPDEAFSMLLAQVCMICLISPLKGPRAPISGGWQLWAAFTFACESWGVGWWLRMTDRSSLESFKRMRGKKAWDLCHIIGKSMNQRHVPWNGTRHVLWIKLQILAAHADWSSIQIKAADCTDSLVLFLLPWEFSLALQTSFSPYNSSWPYNSWTWVYRACTYVIAW